jgi:putative SOS response-associated peptidase YedK
VGLWDRWAKGDGRETFPLLTTTTNGLGRHCQERMPVIRPLAFHDEWLDPQADAAEWLQSALRPYPAQEMEAVPVSAWVNNARHEGPECVQPVV